jgi:hypothetical protein
VKVIYCGECLSKPGGSGVWNIGSWQFGTVICSILAPLSYFDFDLTKNVHFLKGCMLGTNPNISIYCVYELDKTRMRCRPKRDEGAAEDTPQPSGGQDPSPPK